MVISLPYYTRPVGRMGIEKELPDVPAYKAANCTRPAGRVRIETLTNVIVDTSPTSD